MYILCLIGLWTISPKAEVEKWRIEILEVFLNILAGFVNFGKVRKTEETLPIFSEKSKCLKKKKKIYHFASALFSKDMLRIVKGFTP